MNTSSYYLKKHNGVWYQGTRNYIQSYVNKIVNHEDLLLFIINRKDQLTRIIVALVFFFLLSSISTYYLLFKHHGKFVNFNQLEQGQKGILFIIWVITFLLIHPINKNYKLSKSVIDPRNIDFGMSTSKLLHKDQWSADSKPQEYDLKDIDAIFLIDKYLSDYKKFHTPKIGAINKGIIIKFKNGEYKKYHYVNFSKAKVFHEIKSFLNNKTVIKICTGKTVYGEKELIELTNL